MPTTRSKAFNDAITNFLIALVNGDHKKAQKLADQVFAHAIASQNQAFLETNTIATKTMLGALKYAIKVQEDIVKSQHPSKALHEAILDQIKQYANESSAKEREKTLKSLVEQYSKNAKMYKLGMLSNEEAKKLLEETYMIAVDSFNKYCSALLKKLESVELNNEYDREDYNKYLKAQETTLYEQYRYDMNVLIQQSLELVEFDKKIDDSTKKINSNFSVVNNKSLSCAQKLVNTLFQLVELISNLGERLKVILGFGSKEEQGKSLLFKQFDNNSIGLQDANKNKHTLELVLDELKNVKARVELGNRGKLL